MEKIETLYVFVADNPNGVQGLVAEKIGDEWLPFATSKPHLADLMADLCQQIGKQTNRTIHKLTMTIQSEEVVYDAS